MSDKLTAKQEKACRHFVKTGNKSEAYRAGFDTSKMKPNTVHRKANEFFKQDKIVARCQKLFQQLQKRSECTLEEHMAQLAMLRDVALMWGQLPAAVAAEVSRGKAAGHYVKKVEIDVPIRETKDSDLDQLIEEYATEAGISFIAGRESTAH